MPAIPGCARWSETSQESEAAPVASEDGLLLPLLVAKNRSGYFGVSHQTSWTKPYRAQLKRGRAPGQLRHRRVGGAVRRAAAGGPGGGRASGGE